MKDFARALQQAWRHWPSLLIALGCSFGVAALWGANIAALFPIIETTLHGQSLQEWNQKRIQDGQANLDAHEESATKLEQTIAATKDATDKSKLAFDLDVLKTQIEVDHASVYSAQRIQPFLSRYMPSKPFATGTVLALLVALATALQQVLMLVDAMLVG